MKWYLLAHFLNLYVLPVIGYTGMVLLGPAGDITDYAMGILFGYIPIGCLLISFLYGLRKRESLFLYSFMFSFLCIPLSFLRIVSGDGIINHITAGLFLYSGYCSAALMGSIAGHVGYLGYRAVKNMCGRLKRRDHSPPL